ncbi:MAG: hypothetical protein Q7J84_16240 [Sulfuricaulis sp.]|nr:hypothetical protein [Sulfuricaulis sp.]
MRNGTTGTFTKAGTVYDNMPYAGFADLEMLVVEKALRLVWLESPKRFHCHQIDFNEANENRISSALVNVFDDIWANDRHLLSDLAKLFNPVPIFNGQHGTVDYLGRPLEHKPDITFRRSFTDPGKSALNGSLFIEAKLVGQKNKMGKYCGAGLVRFIDGTYAWAMPQAVMLGYVQETSQKLPDSLTAYFERLGNSAQYRLKEGPVAFPPSRFANRSYLTVHDRTWKYPGTDRSPGPISVLHLWLPI